MVDAPAEPQGKHIGRILFGDTDIAGGIPDAYRPAPSSGPVFFEGWLILALSFQPGLGAGLESELEADLPSLVGGKPRSILQLWDCLSGTWFEDSPMVWRYDNQDVVLVDGQPVWSGVLDTRRDVNLVPGWSSECARINNQVYLRWKTRSNKED